MIIYLRSNLSKGNLLWQKCVFRSNQLVTSFGLLQPSKYANAPCIVHWACLKEIYHSTLNLLHAMPGAVIVANCIILLWFDLNWEWWEYWASFCENISVPTAEYTGFGRGDSMSQLWWLSSLFTGSAPCHDSWGFCVSTAFQVICWCMYAAFCFHSCSIHVCV